MSKKSSFSQDKAKGNKAEQIVKGFFEQFGFEITKNTSRSKKLLAGWDLKIQKGVLTLLLEVKRDVKSSLTKNVAIEFHNPYRDQPSGIEATKSDFWIYVIPNNGVQEIWMTSTEELKDFIKNNPPFKTIEVGGDSNASLYLYKKDDILGPLFIFLNNKTECEIMFMFKKYDEARVWN